MIGVQAARTVFSVMPMYLEGSPQASQERKPAGPKMPCRLLVHSTPRLCQFWLPRWGRHFQSSRDT